MIDKWKLFTDTEHVYLLLVLYLQPVVSSLRSFTANFKYVFLMLPVAFPIRWINLFYVHLIPFHFIPFYYIPIPHPHPHPILAPTHASTHPSIRHPGPHYFQILWWIWFMFGMMIDIGPNFYTVPSPPPYMSLRSRSRTIMLKFLGPHYV